jgi:prephenate dehydrogenase
MVSCDLYPGRHRHRLIGTSVALAARQRGVTVYLSDCEASAVRTAAALAPG